MYKKVDKSALVGCGLAMILALSPVRATEVLFDNGEAVVNAGFIGGAGYNTNQLTDWRVYDNFSFDRDLSIESVWFQMAGGTEPFVFSVHEDFKGLPGKKIFGIALDVGDYAFGNFRWYQNGSIHPVGGHDFTFDLDKPLTLAPGKYWVSIWGTGASLFQTLGTGSGDGLVQHRLPWGRMYSRSGNMPFRLIGTPVDDMLVELDIKPGSDKNPVNPKSKGVIPVAVLGSLDFDATQVDPATVLFGPGEARPAHNGHLEDASGDGILDMVLHFKTPETGIDCGVSVAYLTGETFAGKAFTGSDSVEVIGCGNPVTPDAVVDDPPTMITDETDEVTTEDDAADEGSGSGAAAIEPSILLGMLLLLALQWRRSHGGRLPRQRIRAEPDKKGSCRASRR